MFGFTDVDDCWESLEDFGCDDPSIWANYGDLDGNVMDCLLEWLWDGDMGFDELDDTMSLDMVTASNCGDEEDTWGLEVYTWWGFDDYDECVEWHDDYCWDWWDEYYQDYPYYYYSPEECVDYWYWEDIYWMLEDDDDCWWESYGDCDDLSAMGCFSDDYDNWICTDEWECDYDPYYGDEWCVECYEDSEGFEFCGEGTVDCTWPEDYDGWWGYEDAVCEPYDDDECFTDDYYQTFCGAYGRDYDCFEDGDGDFYCEYISAGDMGDYTCIYDDYYDEFCGTEGVDYSCATEEDWYYGTIWYCWYE